MQLVYSHGEHQLPIQPLTPFMPRTGGEQGTASGSADDGQPDRERGLPRVHQRPAVHWLHSGPLYAGKSLFCKGCRFVNAVIFLKSAHSREAHAVSGIGKAKQHSKLTQSKHVQEDKDNFCNAVRAEVKMAGLMDTTENCWAFFINKARA